MTPMRCDWLIKQCLEARKARQRQAQRKAATRLNSVNAQLKALGVRTWSDAMMLPESKLARAGLTMETVLEKALAAPWNV